MKSDVQVAVIGGGVVGTSVLYHLAKAGWTDVVLAREFRTIYLPGEAGLDRFVDLAKPISSAAPPRSANASAGLEGGW